MKEQSLQRRKLAKKKLSMRNPERLLAQKALGAKLRRSESRILLEKISQDKQLYASIIHTRKQLARLETERASPKISRLRRGGGGGDFGGGGGVGVGVGVEGGVGVGVLNNDVDLLGRVNTLNRFVSNRVKKEGAFGQRPQTSGGEMCNRRESERSVLKLAYKVRATANQRPEIHTHEYDNSNGDNHQSESKNKSKASMVGSFGGGRQMGMTGTMINDFRCEVERGTGRPTTAGSRLSSAIKYGGGVRNRPSTANAGVLRSDSELVSMVKDFNTTNSVNNLTVLSESLGRSGIPVRTIMVPPPKLPPGESEPCDVSWGIVGRVGRRGVVLFIFY